MPSCHIPLSVPLWGGEETLEQMFASACSHTRSGISKWGFHHGNFKTSRRFWNHAKIPDKKTYKSTLAQRSSYQVMAQPNVILSFVQKILFCSKSVLGNFMTPFPAPEKSIDLPMWVQKPPNTRDTHKLNPVWGRGGQERPMNASTLCNKRPGGREIRHWKGCQGWV